MENCKSSFVSCFSLGIFLLLLLSHANAENETEPRKNPNLTPFESWRSAYFCMQNTTGCSKYRLTLAGMLTVEESDVSDFCWGGCYEHLRNVMQCIQDVKRDFKFGSNAPLDFVRDATFKGCKNLKGFNTNYTKPNSATSLYGRFYMPLVSTLTTMAIIATFTL